MKLMHSDVIFNRKIELYHGTDNDIRGVSFPTKRKEAFGVRINGGAILWHRCLVPSLVWKDAVNKIKSLKQNA